MALIIIGSILGYIFIAGIVVGILQACRYGTDGSYYYSCNENDDVVRGIFWPVIVPYIFGKILTSPDKLKATGDFFRNLFKFIYFTLIKKHMKSLFLTAIGLVFIIIAVWGVTSYITYSNRYVELTAQYEAQDKVDQVIYDEVWKTVKQEADITDQYAEKFQEIYVNVMDARYKEGAGQLMQWITEQNPNFTPELYGRLMNTIEAKRSEFTANQKKLISLHAELEKLTKTIPSAWFVGNRPIKAPRLVTSTRTGEAFSTGKDDDISLYPEKATKK